MFKLLNDNGILLVWLYSIMHLSSKIISEDSQQLKKELKCYFDHPFQLLPKCTPSSLPISSLTKHNIAPYILAAHEASLKNQCIIVYKYLLHPSQLLTTAASYSDLSMQIIEYDHKHKTMTKKLSFPSNHYPQDKFGEECTIIIQMRSRGKQTKVYLLPFSHGEEETVICRSIHESFKILKVIKQFLMLQSSWKGSLQFQQPIFKHISHFLYKEKVSVIETIIWICLDSYDKKLLQQIGEMKLPQPWLEKEEYRSKKQQMYDIKREQYELLTILRKQKQQFSNTINTLQKLSGLTPQPYHEINLQSLRSLKQQAIIQKVADIKELQNHLVQLQIRQSTLKQRKNECSTKIASTQKKHVLQILALKQQIGALQQVKKKEGLQSFGLIFHRSRKQTDHRMIKTIFTNMDKQAKRIHETESSFRNRCSQSSERKQAKKKAAFRKEQFKNKEKQVTRVVKDGKEGLQINKQQLREDYENQMLKIDFEMEKRYSDMLTRYEQATKTINSAMDQNQQINI